MEQILVIDHLHKGKQSYFVIDLINILFENRFLADVKSYKGLGKVDLKEYKAVISASGFTRIRGNKELDRENELTDICEDENIPILYLTLGAQIKAVHLWGDDAIEESKKPRKSVHSDYLLEKLNSNDPILRNVDLGKLVSQECHDFDIVKTDSPFRKLLTDPSGNTILASHEDPNVISCLMQMHPEFNPSWHPGVNYDFKGKLNSEQLLENFLRMAKHPLMQYDGIFKIPDEIIHIINTVDNLIDFPQLTRNTIIDSVALKETEQGKVYFAKEPIKKGTQVIYPIGSKVNRAFRYTTQIDDNIHIIGCSYVEHSCKDPTLVRDKEKYLMASRDIRSGEKINMDYRTTEYELANPFVCNDCGKKTLGFSHLTKKEKNELANKLPIASYLRKHISA